MSQFFNNIFPKCQYGFRKSFSTQQLLLAMLQKLEKSNLMKSNTNKSHLLVSTNNTVNVRVENFDMKNSHCVKLLGVKFDYKLTFNVHTSDLCKKSSKKVRALARVAPYMNIWKRCITINAFSKSQFSYCPLLWMCHSRINHGKVNRLHERYLRVIYSDKT